MSTIAVKHILISCHADDMEEMTILMNGLAVHGDFINWHVNEFYEEVIDLNKDDSKDPDLQLWHGFTDSRFPWESLAVLLSSVHWKQEPKIEIQIEVDGRFERYAMREFFHAVRGGKIK